MKKNILKITSIFIIFVVFLNSISFCDEIDNSEITIDSFSPTNTSLSQINARSYVVIDRNSNQVLIGKNETEKRKMASTTKIMTATIIIENCNLQETLTISKKAANTGGSRLGLKTGDKITVKDLLYGLMLCSGNDCAVALAEYAGGSIEGFSELMNNKAKSLNLTNTNFETPHGLDSENHYTTAYELATLSNYALKNEIFAKIVGTKYYTITLNGYPKSIHNTNELLGNLNGVYGIKTGFTNGANRCLVTACKRGNLDIICVVLGCDTKNNRTKDSISLIEYTFKNYETINIQNIITKDFEKWKNENINNFYFEKGICTKLDLTLGNLKYENMAIKKDDINSLYTEISCKTNFQAPITNHTEIGSISLINKDTCITKISIYIESDIIKKDTLYYLTNILSKYQNILSSIFNL